VRDLVILGGGGFAREVWWVCEQVNRDQRRWNVLGFVDEAPEAEGKVLCDRPVLGGFGWFETRPERPYVICGVGANPTRRRFVEKARSLGLRFATLVHPAVATSRYVEVGEGSVVCAGTVLTTQIRIGAHVNLNLSCTVGHDAVIENFCNLSPGVHISGSVHLEEGVDIGSGAVVLPGRRVGRDATLGAGAVVTSDVPPRSVAVGVPARVVRTVEAHDPSPDAERY
jgi:sugar O-acyltransferase (sialic acid O-acetyltransferase NeuD family)